MLLARQLEKIRKNLLTLGGLAEENLDMAIRSVTARDPLLAERVIQGDVRLDDAETEVEEECLHALALYQPVAFDLRYLVQVLKINHDLERIGDHAVNIAQNAQILCAQPSESSPPLDLAAQGRRVAQMLHLALEALVAIDATKAAEVRRLEAEVDEAHRAVYFAVSERLRADTRRVETCLAYLSISRQLERMADHAVNIVRDVELLCSGPGDGDRLS